MTKFLIWCEHQACPFWRESSTGEELPPICPSCQRSARWRIEPLAMRFTLNDRRFLKSVGIASTDATESPGAVRD